MEIWIYFDYGIIIKPTYNSCRLRSPTVASIQTSIVVYKYRKTFPYLHSLISSHLSLSLLRRKEALLYCAEKRLSLTRGRNLLSLNLQLQIQSLTSVDHHISSSELRCRSIWTSSEGQIFWWWNQANPTVGLQDINYPSFDDEATNAVAADLGFATTDINQIYCTISLCWIIEDKRRFDQRVFPHIVGFVPN